MKRPGKLVVISGLSGSGKSTVAKCFEDLGYYVVDNLPLSLLRRFVAEPLKFVGDERDIAVVTDVRAPGFSSEFPDVYKEINRQAVQLVLLFLEASDRTLVQRFSETRRPHPLTKDLPVLEAVQKEREMLTDVRGMADMVLDTSQWSIHESRQKIYDAFGEGEEGPAAMQVSLTSFGFKHGIPMGSDLLFDVRYLPNPHFVEDLRPLTGRDEPVVRFLERTEEFGELLGRLESLLVYLLPRYDRENRSYLSIGVGCTGGRHRSVAIVEALAERLRSGGWNLRIEHRDADRE